MACPHCSARASAKDRYCRECGGRLAPPGDSIEDASASMSWTVGPLRPGFTQVVGRPRWIRMALPAALYLVLAAGSALGVRALLHHRADSHEGTITLGTPRLMVMGQAPIPSRPAATAPRRSALPRTGRPVATPAPTPPRRPAAKPAPRSAPSSEPRSKPKSVAKSKPRPRPKPKPRPKPRPRPKPKPKPKPKPRPVAKPALKRPSAQDLIDGERASINADSVRMVIRHHLPQVRACYDRALKQKKDLAGIVEVRFRIKTDGKVGASSVHRNTSGHEGLGKCLAYIIKRWRFPRPVGGAVAFVYPFVFSSSGD